MVGKSSRLKQPPQQCRLLYLEKAPGSTYCGISVYNGGTISKMGMILLTKPCSDKASGSGFKWEEGRFKLDRRRGICYSEGSEALELVAHGSCSYPTSGPVQGLVGLSSEQPDKGKMALPLAVGLL